ADAVGAGVAGAAIGSLHDPGPTAGHHHDAAAPTIVTRGSHEASEFAGDLVIAAVRDHPARDLQTAAGLRIARVRRQGARKAFRGFPCGCGLGNAGASEHDHRVLDTSLLQQHLGLEIVELESHPAGLRSPEEIAVVFCLAVSGTAEDRLDARRSRWILLGGLGAARGERLPPPLRVRGWWNAGRVHVSFHAGIAHPITRLPANYSRRVCPPAAYALD